MKFSERLKALLAKLDNAQISWAEALKTAEELAKDIDAEDKAHEGTSMSAACYGIYRILEAFIAEDQTADGKLEALATDVTALYEDDFSAPMLWQDKPELMKGLRQHVRKMVHTFGLSDWKNIPERVEEYAVKHMAKY
jgi:type I restriction enzyme R subunit